MKRCLIDNKPIKIFHANKMSDHRYLCKYHFQSLGLTNKFFHSKEFQHSKSEVLRFMLNNGTTLN